MNRRQKLIQQKYLNNEQAVIKRLNQVYGQALKDIDGKIEKLMQRFDPETGDLPQSAIYQIQYQKMLQGQVEGILKNLQTKQYLTVSDYLDECYTDGFVGSLFDMHGQGVPLMLPIDQERMVRAVQLESKISKGLYTKLGEDVDMLRRRITAQVSRSILTGTSYAECAQHLANQTRIGYNKSIRIARTEGHRIQCTAAYDAAQQAKERGADVVKQWDATLDAKTRESHVHVDGEVRELDKDFSNGLKFPGDPDGGAGEVVNCRCALLQRARWALDDSFTKIDGFTDDIKTFEDMSAYTEFKEAYFSKENRAYMQYVGTLEERYQTRDFNKLMHLMTNQEYQHFVNLQEARPTFAGMYRGDSYLKTVAEVEIVKPKFIWPEENECTIAVERRWEELNRKYHANVVEVTDSLVTKQAEYDALFENRVKQLMDENPKMRHTTAERKTIELLGDRPDQRSVDHIGGDFNMVTCEMTLNTTSSLMSGTIDTDIEYRAKVFARAERRGRPAIFANVINESLEGAFIHEYGHAIDVTYGVSSHPKFLKFYQSFSTDEIAQGVSIYANTNVSEFIAECFAESVYDDQREMSKEFMKILEEIMHDSV